MKKYISALTLLFLAFLANAQSRDLQTPCAGTGEGRAGDVTISYTIGEMVLVSSAGTSNLLITQGILQPDAGNNRSSSSSAFNPAELQILPNPTRDDIFLRYGLLEKGTLTMVLFDVNGRRLFSDVFPYSSFVTKQYSLAKYPAATYLLQVSFATGSGIIKKQAFRILKTN